MVNRLDDPGEPERPRVERETTVITTGGGGGGSGGLIAAVLVLVAVIAALFLVFGGGLGRATDDVDINVDVKAPDLPDVDLPAVPSEPSQ